MSRLCLNPPHPDPLIDHAARALGARIWHRSRREGRGNWFLSYDDWARLRWTIGAAHAKQVLRRLRFELQSDRSWQTFDGPSQALRLTVNFRTWAVLSGIARHFNVPA